MRDNPEIKTRPLIKSHAASYEASYTIILGQSEMYRRSYTSVNTPGYSAMTRRGRKRLPTNDHTVNWTIKSSTAYTEFSITKVGLDVYTLNNTFSNMTFLMASPSAVLLDQDYNLARSRLAKSINSMKVNLAQAMGERKQTAKLIETNLGRIVDLARAIRHGDIRKLTSKYRTFTRKDIDFEHLKMLDPSKRLSKYWLEYQYGWKPLLQDIKGAADLLTEHMAGDRYHSSIRATAKASTASVETSTYVTRTTKNVSRTTFCIHYRLDSAARQTLAETGIDNPALLAWELLPYSFVVDWFIPVGSYLEALNAFAGFEFIDGWYSRRAEVIYTEDRGRTIARPGWGYDQYSGFGTVRDGIYMRNKIYSFPAVGLPTFRNPLGGEPVARVATALSLLRVLFK